ncbi:hypothetical protein L6J37_04230 [Photobacterium sp. WH77]|uniref:hypothetical protein n=1 Tax=Photobacterium TaxID=657 RepID=UPI001C475137|nr:MULTISPECIES: hypothetical protein [Photobacterium]MBV7261684.1 hypothetical protein [Photobacterium sp. WH24]MCG2836068.1 hypothetical protein [Photobacterium sp. WH77]MCG2843797.1 hypothetical protein [Photobacterium sp. WH80]MDO6581196.1 hypothetical protein [Photobacterium sp. 2_MG-2023]
MAAIIHEIKQDFIPDVTEGSAVTVNFVVDSNNEPEIPGARIEAALTGNARVTHMSYPGSGSELFISADGKTASVTSTAEQSAGWTRNRTISLLVDDIPPGEEEFIVGQVNYYNHEGIKGPGFDITLKRSASGLQPILSRAEFKSYWQDWESQGYIYSYEILLKASSDPITHWKVSFSDLPPGTTIASVTWPEVVLDGSEGVVELKTPKDGNYLINPDTELPVAIQLLYPAQEGEQEKFKKLYNLQGYDLS